MEIKKCKAQENLNAVKDDVKATFDILTNTLRAREKVLLDMAEKTLKEQLERIDNEEQEFYNHVRELEQLCKADINLEE